MVNPFNGVVNCGADAYPVNSDSKTIKTGAITAPDNTTLADIFLGGAEPDENGNCPTFTAISGSPKLTAETPLSQGTGQLAFLGADVFTGSVSGATFGPYSTSDNFASPDIVWHVLVGSY